MRWLKNLVILLLLVGAVFAAGKWYLNRGKTVKPEYRTANVTRDDIIAVIDATGTLEPEEVIDVGAQVAGQILEFGNGIDGKLIDYGSEVQQGVMLARLDDVIYQAAVTEATAQLEQAHAGVARAKADRVVLQSRLDQAQRDWERAQRLGPSEALAQSAFDTYQASFEQAKASMSVGDAAIIQANASVAQAESTLQRAQRNLGYCTITSPVTGIIIDRRVNIGQTVVASLNAPSLFLLAKDLKRMQVWVAVNEADIGRIYPGQPVEYTVDAFPGRSFKGAVNRIRLNAAMTQNVVTYVVEVNTENPDGLLLPYLTANVQFEVNRRENVLVVPNAALRWIPSEQYILPAALAAAQDASAQPARGNRSSATQPAGESESRAGILWVRDGDFVRPIHVTAGTTDSIRTEVWGDELTDGLEIVTGVLEGEARQATGTTNPFLPQFRRGMGGGGGGGRGPR